MKKYVIFKYRERLALPVIRLVLTFWVVATFSQAFAAQVSENTLVIGVGRDFYDGPDSRTYLHGSTHTWEALTYLGEGLKARPWLAESWHSLDGGRVWVFKLREGVRFHDGSVLTASLAKASIERIASRPKYDGAGMYRDLVRLEARGRLELVFHLTEPSPAFPNVIAYYSSPIIHPKVFDENGRLSGLTATGPFRIDEVKEGDRIILKAFSDYWGPKPAYHRVIFRTLLNAQIRAMALITGEVDAIADVGGILPQQAEEIRNVPGVTLKQVEVGTTHYLLFNCRKPPFDDPKARQWLAGVLNREEIVAALVSGAGRVAAHPYSPLAREWTFGHLNPGPGTRPISLRSPLVILLHAGMLERWPYKDIAQIIQAQLGTSGFSAEIAVREPGACYEDLQQGRFHLALQPNMLMTGDPDFFYSYYVASDGPRYCGSGIPEMDDLIVMGRHTMDPSRRKEIYRRLSLLFAEQLPLLPLYHDLSLYAHGPSVAIFSMDHYFRPLLLEARPEDAR